MSMFEDAPVHGNGHEPAGPALPRAESRRWRPLRCGLLNLYRYDQEVFHFERGRLLLRGNNGTGKSRVLALQLPFLLDADISPARVEPDGDPAKRIEWNLLMNRYPDRLGYTWLEFARRDDDGRDHYLTLGIGLHAVAGRGAPNHWHFITRQRIGQDLSLCNAQNQPLSRDRLIEAIGEAGQVFTTAREYRRAVDEALFQLGEARYGALVDLLIQLRQPQLARHLDEKRLSAALSEALPPVEGRIIADVAESFRGLESDRLELQRSDKAGAAAEAFLREYGPYAQCAARRRAAAVRTAHSAYEETQRQLRAAEERRDAATAAHQQATSQLEQLADDIASAEARVRTLEQSPEMRAARDLDQAGLEAGRLASEAAQRGEEAEQAQRRHQRAEQEREGASRGADEAQAEADQAARDAATRAGVADLRHEHARCVASVAPRPEDAAAITHASTAADTMTDQRREAIAHLRKLVAAVERAAAELAEVKRAQTALQGQLDAAQERERMAAAAVDAAGVAMLEAYRTWAASAVELRAVPADDLAEDLAAWCETVAGRSPVAAAVATAAHAALDVLAGLRAAIERDLATARDDVGAWETQLQTLESGRHEPPPRPHTRAESARGRDQPGAPLWTLIDFAEGVSEADRGGLEAALEAAGLLDAWVTPEGSLLGPATLDTCLVAGQPTAPPDEQTLRAVLRPDAKAAAEAGVDEAIVRALLGRVGLGSDVGDVWIDPAGTWANGPLHGRWLKPAAQHIGHAARERDRQRRVAEARAALAAAREIERALLDKHDDLDRRKVRAQQERDAGPGDDAVRQAVARRAEAGKQVADLRDRVTTAERLVHERRQTLSAAEAHRDADARDLGLAHWTDRLDALRDAMHAYERSLATLWPAMRQALAAHRQSRDAAQRAQDAQRIARQAGQRHQEAQRQARVAAERRETLQASVGATAVEIRQRLEDERRAAEHHRQQQAQTRQHQSDSAADEKVARQQIESHTQELRRHQDERGAAIDSLARLAEVGLLAVAHREISVQSDSFSSVTRAVGLARRTEELLVDVPSDNDAWARRQRDVHKHIESLSEALLPQDMRPQRTAIDDVVLISVTYNQQECSILELREQLAEDVAARRSLLEERERQVLEQTLIDEVATHLHDRLHEAERLVATMNQQMTARPTSSGMRLKFTWEPAPDGPEGLIDARKRLLGAGATWSAAERKALGVFLHQQIQAARAADDTATWQKHIEEAFDYRRWHQFAVMRQQEGKWQRLTRRTHGTGSGGEKAVALTLPMFAAASAHYQSCRNPHAPRPILLDEVFAGIDSDMRGKCMGLIEAFDLDFIMTSEREWGCYAEMPGVAIYQLTTMKGNDGVLATRWLWNGRQRVQTSDAGRVEGLSR